MGQTGNEVEAPVWKARPVDCFYSGTDVGEAMRTAALSEEVVLETLWTKLNVRTIATFMLRKRVIEGFNH